MKKIFPTLPIYSCSSTLLELRGAHILREIVKIQDAVFFMAALLHQMQIFLLFCASFMHISTKFKPTYLASLETLGPPVEM